MRNRASSFHRVGRVPGGRGSLIAMAPRVPGATGWPPSSRTCTVVARHGHRGAARLDRHQPKPARVRRDGPARLGLPPIVDDGDLQLRLGPRNGVGIGPLARQIERFEAADVVLGQQSALGIVPADGAEGGGRREQHLGPVLGDHAPELRRIGRADGLAFEDDRGRADQEGRIDDVGMADDPADIRAGEHHVPGANAEDIGHGPGQRPPHGRRRAARRLWVGPWSPTYRGYRADRSPGWPRDRPGRPPLGRHPSHGRSAPSRPRPGDAARSPRTPAGASPTPARHRGGACRPRPAPVSSPQEAAITAFGWASSMRLASSGAANPPKTTEWMAPSPGAGQHRHHGLDDHRHVDHDPVALPDAARPERPGQPRRPRHHLGIAEGGDRPGHRRMVNKGRPIAMPGRNMPVQGVPSRRDPRIGIPAIDRIGAVERALRRDLPIDGLGRLPTKSLRDPSGCGHRAHDTSDPPRVFPNLGRSAAEGQASARHVIEERAALERGGDGRLDQSRLRAGRCAAWKRGYSSSPQYAPPRPRRRGDRRRQRGPPPLQPDPLSCSDKAPADSAATHPAAAAPRCRNASARVAARAGSPASTLPARAPRRRRNPEWTGSRPSRRRKPVPSRPPSPAPSGCTSSPRPHAGRGGRAEPAGADPRHAPRAIQLG